MAYRNFCAVTFAALGLVLVACGGGTASAGKSGVGDQAPINGDQAPDSASDAPPANGDAPPPSMQRPPGSSEAPAGSSGRVSTVCQQFCNAVDNLGGRCGGDAMSSVGMDNVCEGFSCESFPPTPCDSELVGVFDCALGLLDQVCQAVSSANGSGGSRTSGPTVDKDFCKKELDAVTSCAEANGLSAEAEGSDDDDDDAGDNDNGTPTTPAASCTIAGGCGNCGSACLTCFCKANGDVTKSQACSQNECATTQ